MDSGPSIFSRLAIVWIACVALCSALGAQSLAPTAQTNSSVAGLVSPLKTKSKSMESSAALRKDYDAFLADHKLSSDSVSLSDFVLIHLVFEATRDAGFWNMHWSITDKPPNSDEIWRQWKQASRPSFTEKTATAECDELSALFAFLAERARVKSVGLFWPYPNHTVAVWTLHPAHSHDIRIVIPTSQIFLTENDTFDTRGFDPWHQKTIYDYTRRDVPDSFELPRPLCDFFLVQLDKYGGASTATLQQLRNLRDAVFQKQLTPEAAAREASRRETAYSQSKEDHSAFQAFISDMRTNRPN
jgi:hypothetical protein